MRVTFYISKTVSHCYSYCNPPTLSEQQKVIAPGLVWGLTVKY